jgi:hypothetical protein
MLDTVWCHCGAEAAHAAILRELGATWGRGPLAPRVSPVARATGVGKGRCPTASAPSAAAYRAVPMAAAQGHRRPAGASIPAVSWLSCLLTRSRVVRWRPGGGAGSPSVPRTLNNGLSERCASILRETRTRGPVSSRGA